MAPRASLRWSEPVRWAAILSVGLLACTPAIYEVPGVQEAEASEVAGCTQIGIVTGKPGVFGPLRDVGLRDARRAALERAREQGGDTVVFDPRPEGEEIYELPGKVYDCGNRDA